MVVSCPSCKARYRLDRQKLDRKKITLRCAKCRQAFKVDFGATGRAPCMPTESRFRVLVAHDDRLLCDAVGDILDQDRIVYEFAHDGQAALEALPKFRPDAALIDVALPGIFAFELIQKIRDLPGFEQLKMILLSSVYNKMAYKRRPENLYGADEYIEKHHLPNDLVPMLNRLRLGLTREQVRRDNEEQVVGEPAVESRDIPDRRYIDNMNQRIQSAEEGEVAAAVPDEDVAKAQRLARIIVADIALYNQSRVEEGIRTGTFLEVFAAELEEGRRLFAERINEKVRNQEDYLNTAVQNFVRQKITDMQEQAQV